MGSNKKALKKYEDRIPIDTNDTIDLGKTVVNEVKRDTLTRDINTSYIKKSLQKTNICSRNK